MENGIRFRKIKQDDDITKILETFFHDEICSRKYPITKSEQKIHERWFKEKIIPQGFSLLAEKAESREICGIALATHATADLEWQGFNQLKSKNSRILFEFDDYVEDLMPALVGNFNYLCLQVIAVSSRHRRKKMAQGLVKNLEELVMKDPNLETITLLASSENSLRLFNLLGYESCKEIVYADYICPESGCNELKELSGEHYRASIMIKNLKKS